MGGFNSEGLPDLLVALDFAVADVDHAMRVLRDIVLMGHQHDGVASRVQLRPFLSHDILCS